MLLFVFCSFVWADGFGCFFDIWILKGVGMITIYKCDWCGEAFDYEDQCEEHEETCEARKREEDLAKLARWKKTFGEVKA